MPNAGTRVIVLVLTLAAIAGLATGSSVGASRTADLAEVTVYPDLGSGYIYYRTDVSPPLYGHGSGVAFRGSNGNPGRIEWRGWVKFNTAAIPDEAVIQSASCSFYCVAIYNTPLLFLTHIVKDPQLSIAETTWNQVGVGDHVIDEPIPCTFTGRYPEEPLGAAGLAAIQAGLADDWVALGFLDPDHPGTDQYGIAAGHTSAKPYQPYLKITYTTGPQPPKVRVDVPNGGENWVIGTSRTVACTHYGGTADFDSVLVSRDGGTNWEFLFKEPAAGTHEWTVTGPTTTQARIRVVAINAVGTGSDDSNHDFTISSALEKPVVVVVSPNGGETWTIGTEQIVRCTHSGGDADYDSLLVSRDGGVNWEFLFKEPAANTHHWTVTGPATTQARIRIVAVNEVGKGSDDSNGNFTIAEPAQPPAVRVKVPNGGESWVIGEPQTIECEHTGGTAVTDSVLISRNGGLDWTFLFKEPAASAHAWTVTGPATARARIRIVAINASGETGSDDSDEDFAIVANLEPPTVGLIQPNGGQHLEVGEVYPIAWSHGGGTPVRDSVWYSTNNGTDWLFVAAASPAITFYDWTVPNTPTTQARVRVKASNAAGSGEDASDGPFEISTEPRPPQVRIEVPNGGESWVVGTEQTISCRHSGGTALSDSILLSVDGGESWLFQMRVPAAETHRWTVVPVPTSKARIRVVAISTSGETGSDDSDGDFSIVLNPPWPFGWHEVKPMPGPLSGKPVKDGGWLAAGADLIFAAKGYKTGDFYAYEPLGNTWVTLETIPSEEQGRTKPPYKGCRGISDNAEAVYMTKGNNTLGFWHYDVQEDTWTPLAGVPLGNSRKRVKGGEDLVYVQRRDTGWVYLLKGYGTEFYRYNVQAKYWDTLPEAPYGANRRKYDKGSFLVYDGVNTVYAHQAKYYDRAAPDLHHYMFRYDIAGDSWYKTPKRGMPAYGLEGGRPNKKKKSKDGGAGAWYRGSIYALKGGNTQGFFRYYPSTDTWVQLDTVPGNGTTDRKKRVKAGGDLVYYGYGAFFALKGNKTCEAWRYRESTMDEGAPPAAGGRNGAMSERCPAPGLRLTIAPNPIAAGFTAVRFSLPGPGPVLLTVFDVVGRAVFTTRWPGHQTTGSLSLDLRGLSAGVYLVRAAAGGAAAGAKLIVR